jgi:hypothetical protein
MHSPRTIIATLLMLAVLCGCSMRAKKTPVAATPSAPKPAVGTATPPPREPVSIPQTQVHLPPPQPVTEAALATMQEAAVIELPAPPETKPVRRVTSATPPPGPKPETPPVAAGPAPPPATQQPATTEPERPRIQELVSPTEQKQLSDSLDARKREIRQKLDQATARGPSNHDRTLMNRIRSFVKLSDEALGRGDLRQADALAERAQILSRELQGAR